MASLYQSGGQKISMSKKLHKKLEELIGEVLDEEGALLACGLVLTEAFDYAKEIQDIEKMIDIADRWMILSKMLGGEELEELEFSSKMPIGFIAMDSEDREGFEDDSPERDDKGKGRVKICKKSRKLRERTY